MTSRSLANLTSEPTHYVNVDLDVFARTRLDGFVQALGNKAFVLHVGGAERKYEAHIELASSHVDMSADDTIVGLVSLIRGLPPIHRKTWDSAQRREFNIGIEAGLEPHGFEFRLRERTWSAIKDVGGVVVFTVYAPDLRMSTRTTKRLRERR